MRNTLSMRNIPISQEKWCCSLWWKPMGVSLMFPQCVPFPRDWQVRQCVCYVTRPNGSLPPSKAFPSAPSVV